MPLCVCSGSATAISISRCKSETNFSIPSLRRREPSPASPAGRVTAGPPAPRAGPSSPLLGAGHSTSSITAAETVPSSTGSGLPPAGRGRGNKSRESGREGQRGGGEQGEKRSEREAPWPEGSGHRAALPDSRSPGQRRSYLEQRAAGGTA